MQSVLAEYMQSSPPSRAPEAVHLRSSCLRSTAYAQKPNMDRGENASSLYTLAVRRWDEEGAGLGMPMVAFVIPAEIQNSTRRSLCSVVDFLRSCPAELGYWHPSIFPRKCIRYTPRPLWLSHRRHPSSDVSDVEVFVCSLVDSEFPYLHVCGANDSS